MAQTAAEAQLVAGRLNAIQTRLDASTANATDWMLADNTDPDSEWYDDGDVGPMVVTDDSEPGSYAAIAENIGQGNDEGLSDARFIAAAPSDIRWLLALVSSLYDQLDKKE